MNGISFIGGGRMAEAMISGLLAAKLVAADRVWVADPDAARRELLHKEYGVKVFEDAVAVWGNDLVVLAVKPQVVEKVLGQCRAVAGANHLLVSIAAGISIATLEGALAGSNARVIRVMPNTPALVQQGATALSAGTLASADDLKTAQKLFDAVGVSVILPEHLLDAVTGLSGSGPAYVLSFIEAMIDSGIKGGLDQTTARTLVLQTVLGTATMAMQTGEHPAQLRAMVTSPGGTTIAGLQIMERAGFNGIVMEAVEAAVRRSQELGKPRA